MELTSGNTGTGLATVCAVKGYPFVAVMSAGNSTERAQMMRALGAEVILVDQHEGSLDGHVTGDDLALVEEVAEATAPAGWPEPKGSWAASRPGPAWSGPNRCCAHAGQTVAILIADSGMKYLSTDLWDDRA